MSEIRKVKIKEGLIKCNLPKNRKFKHSEETKEKIRKKRIGEKNPRYGIKEDYEHKLARMRNLLATPDIVTGKQIGRAHV